MMSRILIALALIAFAPIYAIAFVNSSVLTALEATTAFDDFNYTENPISNGGTWTTPVNTGESAVAANGTVAFSPAISTDYTGYRNDRTWGSNVATMMTISGINAADEGLIGIWVALQGSGLGSGSPNGYRGEVRIRAGAGTDEWRIQRLDSGTLTVISSGTIQEVTAGDKFAVIRNGSTIELWWKTGSSWTAIVSVADTTYTAGGKVGISLNDNTNSGITGDDLKVMNLSRQKCVGCGTDRKIIGDR